MEQAASETSHNVLALSATDQSGAELPDGEDNSPLVLDTTPKQTLMQSEVLAVQSNNTQDNPIITTDDHMEQTAEVDTTFQRFCVHANFLCNCTV